MTAEAGWCDASAFKAAPHKTGHFSELFVFTDIWMAILLKCKDPSCMAINLVRWEFYLYTFGPVWMFRKLCGGGWGGCMTERRVNILSQTCKWFLIRFTKPQLPLQVKHSCPAVAKLSLVCCSLSTTDVWIRLNLSNPAAPDYKATSLDSGCHVVSGGLQQPRAVNREKGWFPFLEERGFPHNALGL